MYLYVRNYVLFEILFLLIYDIFVRVDSIWWIVKATETHFFSGVSEWAGVFIKQLSCFIYISSVLLR